MAGMTEQQPEQRAVEAETVEQPVQRTVEVETTVEQPPEKRSGWGPFGAAAEALPHEIERITIRTYPKIIFLYPSVIFAFIAAFFTQFDWGSQADWGLAFMVVLGFNFCVLAFDFPRTASLTLVFIIVAIVLAAILLNERSEFLPALADQTTKLKPSANSTFYWMYAIILTLIMAIVWVIHRFIDYWEVLSNEIIHHQGILGGIDRIPAPGVRLEKDITDVFEYLLLRSGRMVITPAGESRAIVMDNVPNINRVEDGVKAILGVTEVSVRQRDTTLR
jgi:hypothetical protein